MDFEKSIIEYTGKNKMQEDLEAMADRLMKNNGNFVVWGYGSQGKGIASLIEQYSNGKLSPEFFIDNNPMTWGDGTCISPNEFYARMYSIDVLLIGVYVADQVERQVRAAGYSGEIMSVVPSVIYSKWIVDLYNDHFEEVKKLWNKLPDEQSRDTISAIINVSRSGDVSYWKDVNGNSDDKGLDNSILNITDSETYIDVGAFIGDTVERFLEISKGKYNSIVAIEPDGKNFKHLEKYLENIKNSVAIKAAVCETDCVVTFNESGAESSSVAQSGIEVKGICLDNAIETQKASLIKMSTLGYELPVIKGSKNIIVNNKPKLAYYCSGTQAWSIPDFIHSIDKDYKCYIRHYGIGTQGLMGYAVV